MANDTNRITIAGTMVERTDSVQQMNVTIAGTMVERTDSVQQMNVTIAGTMVERRPPLPVLIVSDDSGPVVQIV